MSAERWKPIGAAPGYFISDRGQVRSERKCRGVASRLLKPHVTTSTGYLSVALPVPGSRRFRIQYIHRLVLDAFVGPCPAGHVCAHLDGSRTNNSFSNLAWASFKENMAHKKLHGTEARGEKRPNAKLTAPVVIEIRRLWEAEHSPKTLANRFGVSKSAIEAIVYTNRSWRHVS